jgi:hypothetical protein
MSLKSLLIAAALISTAASAHATATLTGNLTADNQFDAYISTSNSTLGTLVASGTNWQQSYSFSTTLTAGTTYYLHVVAWNDPLITPATGGNPDAFIGSFSLTGSGFTFADGGASLDTDTTDWQADVVSSPAYPMTSGSWVAPGDAPTSFATNGNGIWGTVNGGPVAGISSNADFIWGDQIADTGESFFSTKITASAVPEPAGWALMLVGLGGIGGFLRRRHAIPAV